MRESSPKIRVRLARNIRQQRLSRGLSQAKLAERAGVTERLISQIERAATNVGIDTVGRIASTLAIDYAELFRGSTDNSQMVAITKRDARRLVQIGEGALRSRAPRSNGRSQ